MSDLLAKIVSLAKRRGFIFQSSEIYGGLKSAYDYGPLGVELKRNIAAEWWRRMVQEREDIVGLDASIFMRPEVWRTSGHVANFSDPLVDCLNCRERFRADKAPQKKPGEEVSFRKGGKESGEIMSGVVSERGYVCPQCGSSNLSAERQFNLMFRSSLGPVDPFEGFLEKARDKQLTREQLRGLLEESLQESTVYLRPETAQAIFVQFLNVQQSLSMKVPFGIAQQGKSFRNEVITEKFIFRTCEFEQMEMEYFVEPGTEDHWANYWIDQRLSWWRSYANQKDNFRARAHGSDELAHYAAGCSDIEYQYPWGWDELEGVASRTDYDLGRHTEESGVKLSYFDQNKPDPKTGKMGWRYTPYVIEPAAGLTRGVLVYLLDAFCEERGVDAEGTEKSRLVLKLHPRLAPVKVGVFPLLKKDGLPEIARDVTDQFLKLGITAKYDEQQSIGKRYSKHDEIGTPFCLTIDHQTKDDMTLTVRNRDTTEQKRIPVKEAVNEIHNLVYES